MSIGFVSALLGRSSGGSARSVYAKIVEQARMPEFYRDFGVPDTVDGRFEMIALHVHLVLRRLKGEGGRAPGFAQALFDAMFDDMDVALREMGAGDMGVGKRVKTMVQAFYGRIASYDDALARGGGALTDALARNAFGTTVPERDRAEALARYVRKQDAHLSGLRADDILSAKLRFQGVADD